MFKIVAMIFIGILAAIGFFDLGQEAYNACGAFARHRCPPGLRPKGQEMLSPGLGDRGLTDRRRGSGWLSPPVMAAMMSDRPLHGHVGHFPSGEAVNPTPR